MTEMRTCAECGQTKPLTAFGSNPGRKTCSACRMRATRAGLPPEERASQARMQARRQRAGVRKGVCVSCGDAIEDEGFCSRCRAAVIILGDTPEALKNAARALKYLQDE